jgi:hypothetical protein
VSEDQERKFWSERDTTESWPARNQFRPSLSSLGASCVGGLVVGGARVRDAVTDAFQGAIAQVVAE